MKPTSFMQPFVLALCLFVIAVIAGAQQSRPQITGISHMCLYSSDAGATEHFYVHDLGATKAPDPQDPNGTRYYFSATQFVEALPLPADHTISRMACVAFRTSNADGLLKYLQAKGVDSLSQLHTSSDGSHWFQTKDPEGNQVQFVEPGQAAVTVTSTPIGNHIIHVGYLVRNKSAEDHFYKEILGFRAYWFGGMQPDHIDWVSQQVPDGHDWLEYMLVGEGSDTPLDKVDQQRLGVMNHFSVGVPNMEQAVTTLMREDRLSPRHDGPQMGKDGKWQANFYDPDGTRVELMEFQPVIKPCCSDFTADSPLN